MAKKSAQIQPVTKLDLLSEVQHRAAQAIASGESYRAVADSLGVNPSTLSEWQKKPEFRAKVNELLVDAEQATRRRLVSAAGTALNTLLDICTKTTASDRDKITAASKILDLVGLQPMPPGHTDPKRIEADQQLNDLLEDLIRP